MVFIKNKYLKWFEQITTEDEFAMINTFIVEKEFKSMNYTQLQRKEIDLKYKDKIKLYSLNENRFIRIKNI